MPQKKGAPDVEAPFLVPDQVVHLIKIIRPTAACVCVADSAITR